MQKQQTSEKQKFRLQGKQLVWKLLIYKFCADRENFVHMQSFKQVSIAFSIKA